MSSRSQQPQINRSAGVLLHVTSLPGPHGIGDFGPAAYRWVDDLARAKQRWWQILPLGPPGAGDSPYQCYSAFAGNPALVSPDLLVRDGLLRRSEVSPPRFPNGHVDFGRAVPYKWNLLVRAWERFNGGAGKPLRDAFDAYRAAEKAWLDDFALFMALRDAHGDRSWTDWPKDIVLRKPAALRAAREELADAIGRHQFVQFLFARQWVALKRYANDRGVGLVGDLPIFVSPESADVWANPQLFLLDRHRRPAAVAGVPPDYFSATGQRWGNPLYDWPAMKRDGYAWWTARLAASLAQTDLVRIDHFRGFAACWTIPARLPTAVGGRWVKTPGPELFQAVRRKLGRLPFIAEDLGVITPDVEALRDDLGLPGMRVLQFGFGGDDGPFLPHNYVRNAVVYTGTHDNDTTAGWYASLDRPTRARLRRYAPDVDADPAWALIRLAWSSVADRAITPLQDVLSLGTKARMNYPGRPTGNWGWRLDATAPVRDRLTRLGEWTETYGRAHPLAKT